MWDLILTALAGYLLGSISVAVIITKYIFRDDVREQGSGNAGATNVARVFGMRMGLITLAGDMAKTILSAWIGTALAGSDGFTIGCAACLIGHCWPVYFGFHGGKGVSVSACIGLLMGWRLFLALAVCFFTMFALTRRVSACSIASAVVFPVAYYLIYRSIGANFWLCCLICVLVIFLHRSNIGRLLRGEEPPFHPGNKNTNSK